MVAKGFRCTRVSTSLHINPEIVRTPSSAISFFFPAWFQGAGTLGGTFHVLRPFSGGRARQARGSGRKSPQPACILHGLIETLHVMAGRWGSVRDCAAKGALTARPPSPPPIPRCRRPPQRLSLPPACTPWPTSSMPSSAPVAVPSVAWAMATSAAPLWVLSQGWSGAGGGEGRERWGDRAVREPETLDMGVDPHPLRPGGWCPTTPSHILGGDC